MEIKNLIGELKPSLLNNEVIEVENITNLVELMVDQVT